MPIGGIFGARIGAILGDLIGHTFGGHIGGRSILLLHSACMSPFTHLHTQRAFASEIVRIEKISAAPKNNFNISLSYCTPTTIWAFWSRP